MLKFIKMLEKIHKFIELNMEFLKFLIERSFSLFLILLFL